MCSSDLAFVVSIADIITTYLPKVFVDGILDKNVVLARRAVAAFLSVIVFYNIVAVICAVILSDRKEKRQMFFVERLFSHTFCVKQDHQLFHYEGTEQLQGHLLGQAALVDLQLGAYHDDGPAGVVHPLAQQVLAEAALLALEHVGEALEGPVVGAGDGAAPAAVVVYS